MTTSRADVLTREQIEYRVAAMIAAGVVNVTFLRQLRDLALSAVQGRADVLEEVLALIRQIHFDFKLRKPSRQARILDVAEERIRALTVQGQGPTQQSPVPSETAKEPTRSAGGQPTREQEAQDAKRYRWLKANRWPGEVDEAIIDAALAAHREKP